MSVREQTSWRLTNEGNGEKKEKIQTKMWKIERNKSKKLRKGS